MNTDTEGGENAGTGSQDVPQSDPMADFPGICDRLFGPHEWGYRCAADGGFVADRAPFEAAETIQELAAALHSIIGELSGMGHSSGRSMRALNVAKSALAGLTDPPDDP